MKENSKMFFYKLDDSGAEVIKYQVCFDRERILKIRQLIIDKCSVINPSQKYIGTVFPDDIKATAHNVIMSPHTESSTRREPQFCWTYDEYELPLLAIMVDRLLNGDSTVLPFILGKKPDMPKKDFLDEIAEMREACRKIDDADSRKIDKLREFQALLKKVQVNECQKAPMHYFDAIKHEVITISIDSIPLEDIKKILEFTGQTLDGLGIYGISTDGEMPQEENKQFN